MLHDTGHSASWIVQRKDLRELSHDFIDATEMYQVHLVRQRGAGFEMCAGGRYVTLNVVGVSEPAQGMSLGPRRACRLSVIQGAQVRREAFLGAPTREKHVAPEVMNM